MKVIDDVTAMLLQKFLFYQKPETANFEQAVLDFEEQIPNIAKRLLELINTEHTRNARKPPHRAPLVKASWRVVREQ